MIKISAMPNKKINKVAMDSFNKRILNSWKHTYFGDARLGSSRKPTLNMCLYATGHGSDLCYLINKKTMFLKPTANYHKQVLTTPSPISLRRSPRFEDSLYLHNLSGRRPLHAFSTIHADKARTRFIYNKSWQQKAALNQNYTSSQAFLYAEQNSFKDKRQKRIEFLDSYHRSNQDTCLVHKPAVYCGEWVESGDFLADSSASMNGELAIGKNIIVAYMPWEGFNYEDAILINERLVYDDVYTSVHIERYEIETKENQLGPEQITRDVPDVTPEAISHLDSYGIAKIGSWISEGDILVGKVTPVNKKTQTPYQRFLFKLLEKTQNPVRDSSLRAPKGIKANVVNVQILAAEKKEKDFVSKQKKGVRLKAYRLKGLLASPARQPSLHYVDISDTPLSSKQNKKLDAVTLINSSVGGALNINKKNSTKDGRQRVGGALISAPLLTTKVSSVSTKTDSFSLLGLRLHSVDKATSQPSSLAAYNNYWLNTSAKRYALGCLTYKHAIHNVRLCFMTSKDRLNAYPKEGMEAYGCQESKEKQTSDLSRGCSTLNKSAFAIKRQSLFKNKYNWRILLKRRHLTTKQKIASVGRLQLIGFASSSQKSNLHQPTVYKIGGYKSTGKPILEASGIQVFTKPFKLSGALFLLKNVFKTNASFNRDKSWKLLAKETKDKLGPRPSLSNLLKKQNKQKELLFQPTSVNIYLAEKRKIQVGDKMAGRHGNKGIISNILPRQDMPFLPDGTPIDIVLNPLGVPSRMNVGQIYECLLGLAGKYLGEHYKIFPFDEIYGAEASRSFVFAKLFEARQKTGIEWLFDPNSPGKIRIFDGRTSECFDQPVTVGIAYMLKLVHMVDDKIHARSTGPYSLVTQQPLRGRAKQGGQRLGEMEVWAIEGYGAAFVLLEMLTIKSDDMTGRLTLWSNLILNKEITIGTPESFKVLVCELQALCLDIGLFSYKNSKATPTQSLEIGLNMSSGQYTTSQQMLSVKSSQDSQKNNSNQKKQNKPLLLKEISHLMLLP
jgi:DNA-directed RNA polymerase beta subunit